MLSVDVSTADWVSNSPVSFVGAIFQATRAYHTTARVRRSLPASRQQQDRIQSLVDSDPRESQSIPRYAQMSTSAASLSSEAYRALVEAMIFGAFLRLRELWPRATLPHVLTHPYSARRTPKLSPILHVSTNPDRDPCNRARPVLVSG